MFVVNFELSHNLSPFMIHVQHAFYPAMLVISVEVYLVFDAYFKDTPVSK